MTGPEHYREAERDIERANGAPINDGTAAYFMARAQVHATLAQTAILVERGSRHASWDDAIGLLQPVNHEQATS